ncbi:MAG: flagellar filament capping protein FliD [Burkholderiales bacterium]
MATTSVSSNTLSSQIAATNKANAQKLITALGAGSGVDVAALAQNLVDAEKAPLLNAINSKIAKNEAKISGYGAVLASMDIIKKAFQALENPSSILKPTVDIGNSSPFNATVASNAAPGNYNLKVIQLASSQRSSSNSFSSSETPLNGGNAFSLQLSVNGGVSKTIRIPQIATSPAGVVTAINAAKLGINATLINKADGSANPYSILISGETGLSKNFSLTTDDGTGVGVVQKILFGPALSSGIIKVAGISVSLQAGDSATQVANKVKQALDTDSFITGAAGRSVVLNQDGSVNIQFAPADGDMAAVQTSDSDLTGATMTVSTVSAFVPGQQLSGLAFTQEVSSKDAIVEFEGVQLRRSSNQITDLVKGLTVELKQESTTAHPIKVSQDTTGVKEKIQALVKSFNDTVSDLGILTGEKNTKDETDVYSGSLQGDSMARSMKGILRNLFTKYSSTPSGSIRSLSDIGIEMTRTGTLELNEAKFDIAIASNADQITTMLTADKENKSYVGDSNRGLIGDAIKQLNQLISSSGTINNLTKSANVQISKYKEELTKLDTRMSIILLRYSKQFSVMNSFVGNSNAMRNNLKSQFENMASIYKNN